MDGLDDGAARQACRAWLAAHHPRFASLNLALRSSILDQSDGHADRKSYENRFRPTPRSGVNVTLASAVGKRRSCEGRQKPPVGRGRAVR